MRHQRIVNQRGTHWYIGHLLPCSVEFPDQCSDSAFAALPQLQDFDNLFAKRRSDGIGGDVIAQVIDPTAEDQIIALTIREPYQ